MARAKKKTDQTTLKWLNVLNFYQPPLQDVDFVQKITEECYLPVNKLLLERPEAKAVVNVSGCLLETLNEQITGGKEIIDGLKILLSRRQIEITGSGKYYPIFPLIPEKEVKRQINLQEESLKHYLDVEKTPDVLFPPELAYLSEQAELFREMGYQWVVIDEISLKKKKAGKGGCQLKEIKSGINLLVSNRELSKALCNSTSRTYDVNSPGDFVGKAVNDPFSKGVIVTVLDVEAFSNKRTGRCQLLAELYDNPCVDSVSVDQASTQYNVAEVVETIPGSYATNSQQVSNHIYFPLWYNPDNPIHRLLWQLFDLALDEIRLYGSESDNETLDRLLNSDTFSSSGSMLCWDGIMAEKTSDMIVNLLEKTRGSSNRTLWSAQTIRRKIYDEVSMLMKTGSTNELQGYSSKPSNDMGSSGPPYCKADKS